MWHIFFFFKFFYNAFDWSERTYVQPKYIESLPQKQNGVVVVEIDWEAIVMLKVETYKKNVYINIPRVVYANEKNYS